MLNAIILILCVFLTAWQGTIFVGNALNDSLEMFMPSNILILATGITGIALHCMGVY